MSQQTVAIVVTNDLTGDSRIHKLAASAASCGYRAVAFGTARADLPTRETIANYEVWRVGAISARKTKSQLATQRGSFKWFGQAFMWVVRRLQAKSLESASRLLGKSAVDPRTAVANRLRARAQRIARDMVPALTELRPDIIHANDPDTLTLAMEFAAAADYPVAVVYDSHEYVAGVHRPSKGWNDFMLGEESRWIHQVDGRITVSDAIAELLKNDYQLEQLPSVIRNYPTIENAAAHDHLGTIRKQLELPTETPLHVYVGVCAHARGIDTLIDALPSLPGHHVALVTVRNDYVQGLITRADELGVGNRLHVLPYVPAPYVATYISDATSGMNPLLHFQNHELACPTKLYEFIHADLPIVTSDILESSQFVSGNKVGEVFIAGDTAGFVAAVNRLMENLPAYRAGITEDLKFSTQWESQNQVLNETYQSAYAHALKRSGQSQSQ